MVPSQVCVEQPELGRDLGEADVQRAHAWSIAANADDPGAPERWTDNASRAFDPSGVALAGLARRAQGSVVGPQAGGIGSAAIGAASSVTMVP
jgi:hypothetical protein